MSDADLGTRVAMRIEAAGRAKLDRYDVLVPKLDALLDDALEALDIIGAMSKDEPLVGERAMAKIVARSIRATRRTF